MGTLLIWKGQLQKIYAGYSFYILKLLQFLLGILVFGAINSNIGFMKAASSTACTFGLSAVFAFLPLNLLVLAAAVLVLVQVYAVSPVVMLVTAAVFLVMYIFYIRFTPKKAWLIAVAAVAFVLKIPFVIPVAFGLMGGPFLILPAACGTIVYYMMHLIKVTSSALKGNGMKEIMDGLMVFVKQILVNKEMWMMVIVLSLTLLIVYGVRTRAIAHAWKMASVVGAVAAAAMCVGGNLALDLHYSVANIVTGIAAAVISGLILDLFFLSVDYSGTETLQFEDDEYYYYVKAIPKVAGVPVQEKKVKHITEPHEEKKENLKPVMNTLEKKPEKIQEKPAAKAMSKPEADSHLQETIAMGTEEVVNELDRLYEVSEEDLARSVDEILLTKTLNEELEREQEEKKEDMGLTKSIVLGVEKLKENLRNKED